nr:hypothetical protein [Tanacetum cinerariifolium]
LETCITLTRRVEHLEQDKIAQTLEITKLKQRVKKLERRIKLKVSKLRKIKKVRTAHRIDTSEDTVMDDVSKLGGIIANIDADEDVTCRMLLILVRKLLLMMRLKRVATRASRSSGSSTTAKLMTEVVTAASATITAVDILITAAALTLTTAPSAARRRKGVVIRDPEETITISTIIHTEPKSKDKGKGIMVHEPKPLKKKIQIEQDEAYAREYQALKRKPQTEAQARKNMMIYLRNLAGFKMDYFKRMTYDDISPIFEKKFNSNVAFLVKTKEQMEEEDSRALKRKVNSLEDKVAKKQKLDEEVEELRKHLQIVPNDDDDVYTEAIPLALKVPVVDYEIYTENNKPYYKIKRADKTHQLYLSCLSMLRNFDREDLEPDVQDQIWRNQRSVHGLAKVKSWKLLESCGVQIITFTTTQLILLVERKYPLTRFTLDQMLNNVRLKVEEESEVSLELLRFIRQQQQEGFRLEKCLNTSSINIKIKTKIKLVEQRRKLDV